MSEFTSYLSDASSDMMRAILAEAQTHNFEAVNFPIFLRGVLKANVKGEHPLNAFFDNEGIEIAEVEDFISVMISEHCNSLQDKREAEQAKNKPSNDRKTTSRIKATGKRNEPADTAAFDEIKSVITFTDLKNSQIRFPVDNLVYEIINDALRELEERSISIIEPTHFIPAMFNVQNKDLQQLFIDLEANYSEAKQVLTYEAIFDPSIIPFGLSAFLRVLNDKVDTTHPCEILERDTECESIWNIMLKKNKRNAVIVGEAGVGKSALIEKITYDIKNGTSPVEFKDFKVISLDVNSLIAGTSFRGDAEERISKLIKFLEKNSNVILFIDEVHTILGAGSCFEGEMDLANALKPILARGDTIVIGATTSDEYEKYFKSDTALSRRFEKVEVKEPPSNKVYPMIKNKLDVLSNFHGVKISRELVNYAIMIAGCFAFEKKNPDKTLDLVDRAMVTAKRSGKKYVDKRSVLRNFDIFFENWDNMSEESKTATAYHEAGHYLVAKASDKLTDLTFLAVSIMPSEDYLGVTVMEHNSHNVPLKNQDYYIDDMAVDLAGRAAEKLYTESYSSGASSDLKRATKTAYEVVTKLGLLEDDNSFSNRVYLEFENNDMFSEKATNLINDEVTKLINKAYRRAEELIAYNKDVLSAIVAALLQKHIMSEVELDKLWKNTINKRTTSKGIVENNDEASNA